MVEAQQTAGRGTPGDDTARFLRELRQLRDYAGLGQAELAARAHYPRDHITAAEIGPAVPDLPLLSAYVRGCGGTVEEWEERWRTLTNTPALTLLPSRSAGCSTAASAGARIGSISPAADIPDPAMIMAALNRVAEKIAASTPSAPPPRSTPSPLTPRVATSSYFAPASAAAGGGAGTGSTAGTGGFGNGFGNGVAGNSAIADGGNGTATAAAGNLPVSGAMSSEPTATGASATTGAANDAQVSTDTWNSSTDTRASEARASTPVNRHAAAGRRFGLTSRTTVAALVALAICVIVAVLAIFA